MARLASGQPVLSLLAQPTTSHSIRPPKQNGHQVSRLEGRQLSGASITEVQWPPLNGTSTTSKVSGVQHVWEVNWPPGFAFRISIRQQTNTKEKIRQFASAAAAVDLQRCRLAKCPLCANCWWEEGITLKFWKGEWKPGYVRMMAGICHVRQSNWRANGANADLDAPHPLMEITRDASWEPPLKIMMDLLFMAGSTKTLGSIP